MEYQRNEARSIACSQTDAEHMVTGSNHGQGNFSALQFSNLATFAYCVLFGIFIHVQIALIGVNCNFPLEILLYN